MALQDAIRRAIAGATGGLLSSEDIELSIRELLFKLLAGFVLVLMAIYAVVHLVQERHTLSALCGLGFAATAACAAWGRHVHDFTGPLRVLCAALFVLLGYVTMRQGAGLPAAGWWLSIIPFILAGGGLHYMAIAGVFGFIGIVSWMHLLGPTVVMDPVTDAWRGFAAIVGSELLAMVLIIVTLRRRAQVAQALEAARAAADDAARVKARFLATMSHEIRTPLNGVIGAAELLDSPRMTPEQRTQMVALQRQSARTLLALLNDVLDMAKLEAGGVTLERRPVYLRGVVFEANELFSVQAFGKGIELTSSCNPDVAGSFVGDPMRLRQIVNNLVSNAVKFTQRGGVHIHLSLDAHEDHNPTPQAGQVWVRIEVVDSGPGIPPEVEERLFRPFVQADESTSREHGGTGLGLAISQDLARLMGGRIELRSRVGEGSNFALVVPLTPAQGHVEPPWTMPARRKDLVLVTANPGLERHLKTLLHEMRVEPVVIDRLPLAPSEPAGCRLLLVDAPRLQDADDTAGWLRARHAEGCTVAVLTPLGSDTVLGLMQDALLLYKPVRRRALQAVVATALGGDAPQPRPVPLHDAARRERQRAPHVLVAEDNPVNQVVVQAMLAEAGATCVVAADGEEAVVCALAEPFDLVLMDLQMPTLDGLAATRALRREERARGRPHVRVIAMTANAEQDEGPSCLDAGMDGFLAKPFSLQQLRLCLAGISAGSPSCASTPGPAT